MYIYTSNEQAARTYFFSATPMIIINQLKLEIDFLEDGKEAVSDDTLYDLSNSINITALVVTLLESNGLFAGKIIQTLHGHVTDLFSNYLLNAIIESELLLAGTETGNDFMEVDSPRQNQSLFQPSVKQSCHRRALLNTEESVSSTRMEK